MSDAITRKCARCYGGVESCVIGDFWVCNLCDKAKADEAAPEPVEREITEKYYIAFDYGRKATFEFHSATDAILVVSFYRAGGSNNNIHVMSDEEVRRNGVNLVHPDTAHEILKDARAWELAINGMAKAQAQNATKPPVTGASQVAIDNDPGFGWSPFRTAADYEPGSL